VDEHLPDRSRVIPRTGLILSIALISTGCGHDPTPPPPAAVRRPFKEQAGVENAITRVLAEQFNKKPEEIRTTTSLHDLGADELDLVEITMQLEETFDVTIADESLEKAGRSSGMEATLKGLTVQKLAELVAEADRNAHAASKSARPASSGDARRKPGASGR
jgi:acyl carrier protein